MAAESPVRSSLVVESEPSALSRPCRQILGVLEAKGFSQDDVFAVHLALEEAFLNAVKHGNKMDASKKVVVEISVCDEGEGFDPGTVPDPRIGDNLFRPEGRGLLLINSYMHTVEYTSGGTCLRMVRYKGRPVPDRNNASVA